MASMAAFYETRNTLRNFVDYTEPLSFEEWKAIPDDSKAAVLYLQFFDQITLAWDKANKFDFVSSEEGVEIALQYLQKLVCDRYLKGHIKHKVSNEYFNSHPEECEERRILESDPRNFYGGFIYRVMYNSLYIICHDIQSVKDRWEFETSSIIQYDGEELCLFDTMADVSGSASDVSDSNNFEREFWAVIEDTGLEAEKVMRYLLSHNKEDLKKMSKKAKAKHADPLSDVEVPIDSVQSIIDRIKQKFLDLPYDSPCGSYITNLLAASI